VNVLDDQREGVFAAIRLARLTDRTRRRVGPERLVVRAAVVVAREAEQAGKGQDQKGRRKRQPSRPPSGLRSEPRVRGIAPNLGRVKRGEVRSIRVVSVLKRGPRSLDDERRQDHEDDYRLNPPRVAAQRLAKPTLDHRQLCMRHSVRLLIEAKDHRPPGRVYWPAHKGPRRRSGCQYVFARYDTRACVKEREGTMQYESRPIARSTDSQNVASSGRSNPSGSGGTR
jgi:hypothetical protein